MTNKRDRHREPGFTVRPPAELKQAAITVLKDRDREVVGFVVACLTALVNDPEPFLAQLEEHWPAPKPRGRPRPAKPQGTSEP